MNRTTAICALLPLLLAAQPAVAADDDLQSWNNLHVTAKVTDDVTTLLEGSYRFRDGTDQFLTRGSLDAKVAPGVQIGGGVTFAQAGPISEFRPHQQVVISAGHWTFRTRMEERWFDQSPRAQLRLRQRAQVALPLAEGLQAALAGEVLYALQWQKPGRDHGVEQWRLNATLTKRIAPDVDVMAGYLMINTPVPDAENRRSHVGQLVVTCHL